MNAAVAHTIVACFIVVGYVVLVALGHDGTDLLVAGGGYGIGAGVQAQRKATE